MKTLLVSLLALSACGLEQPAPHPFVRRNAVTPMLVCWLEIAGTEAPGGFGAAGWTRAARWDVTTSALLIRHPKGDVLLDTGLTQEAKAQARELSAWGRFTFSRTAGRNEVRANLPALLKAAGVDHVSTIILSHAHPDHAGGVPLVPGAKVYVAAAEKAFMARALEAPQAAVLPSQAREVLERAVEIPFTPVPYANYDQSFDLFGDGSVVIVPAPGHTPGSVVTFVTLPDRRLVHVGDLINLQESIARGVPKSFAMRSLTDEDVAATDAQVAKLLQLQKMDPALWVLPAHDRPAWTAFFGPLEKGASVPKCVN